MAAKQKSEVVYTPKRPQTLNIRLHSTNAVGTLLSVEPNQVICSGTLFTKEQCGGDATHQKRVNNYIRRLAQRGEVTMRAVADESTQNKILDFNQGVDADDIEQMFDVVEQDPDLTDPEFEKIKADLEAKAEADKEADKKAELEAAKKAEDEAKEKNLLSKAAGKGGPGKEK